jgi:hypothetical protein
VWVARARQQRRALGTCRRAGSYTPPSALSSLSVSSARRPRRRSPRSRTSSRRTCVACGRCSTLQRHTHTRACGRHAHVGCPETHHHTDTTPLSVAGHQYGGPEKTYEHLREGRVGARAVRAQTLTFGAAAVEVLVVDNVVVPRDHLLLSRAHPFVRQNQHT